MADVLVSIAQKTLTDVVGQELPLFAGATHELENLSATFQSIQGVLADAERRQASDENVKRWLSKLRHVAYDIEDMVEDGRISGLGDEEGSEGDGNRRKKARWWSPFAYNPSDYASSSIEVANDIKEIKERLDQIDVERNRFGFSGSPLGGDQSMLERSQRLTSSLIDESEIIGRENDKETMISRLVSGSSSNEDRGQAQVVAIAGIGGLGKTTLARLLYHDAKVRGHFNQAVYWVCVSEPFDVTRLTKEIIEEVKREPPTLSALNALQEELLQLLREKRYLLVLDDVWNDDAEKWEMLRLSLASGANGSRILVTTRSEKAANTMNANYIHELKGLSDDQSWTLFSRRAFTGSREGDSSKFQSIGKEIVKKCKGVPLSIKVTGIAMNAKRTVEDWKNILESKVWSLQQATDKILSALLLTYCNLPTRLKQCFAYCSMFPKDWQFKKDVLVKLWVAQGFIQSDGNREKEDIGDEYFDELVARSMFQQVQRNHEGKIICKMHDLLHDLAEFIAKDEIYCGEGGEPEESSSSSSNVRHAFLSSIGRYDKHSNIPIASGRAKKLRTLWLNGISRFNTLDGGIDEIFHEARFLRALYFPSSKRLPKGIGKLKHLRYLHLPHSQRALPVDIGKMKRLRYLDLSCSGIVKLPESVSDLLNLHTLNLYCCLELKELPRGIGRMVSLRYLEIEWTEKLEYLPKGLGRISGLRSLCKFIVGGGDDGDEEEGCGTDELQSLNSLQGSLDIHCLERVTSQEEAEKAELWKKQYLCSLVLNYRNDDDNNDAETETIDSVLEGLRPHENLEELTIYRFTGSKLPSWMDGMRCLRKLVLRYGPLLERVPRLPSLEEFYISFLRNEILPDDGWEQLVALQKLDIYGCRELKRLPEGLTQLPSLEQLHIHHCNKFESLPEGLGQLKKLTSLNVVSSEALRCLPDSVGQLESLQSLNIYANLKKLESMPDSLGQLKKLKSLHVGGSEMLTCLPDSVGELESLEHLRIDCLKKLESVPVSLGQLKKLKSLEFRELKVLTCLPDSVGELKSLESLWIIYCDKLKSMPDSLGQLESLKHLVICGLKKLESVPDLLGQLKALGRLDIQFCEAIASLPQGLRHLSSLYIMIENCPLLSKRCMREGGVDWPNVFINGRGIHGQVSNLSSIPVLYLNLMEDIHQIGSYALGAAMSSHLSNAFSKWRKDATNCWGCGLVLVTFPFARVRNLRKEFSDKVLRKLS